MNVRKAAPSDIRDIAEIQVRSWRAAYKGIISEEFLASLNVDSRVAVWRSCLDSGGRLYVVEDSQSDLIGFLCLGSPRDDDMTDATELQAIYLRPSLYGSGIGTRFWNEVQRDISTDSVYLWALVSNAIGRAFYEKNGFRADGSRKTISLGGQDLEELRYVKRLPG